MSQLFSHTLFVAAAFAAASTALPAHASKTKAPAAKSSSAKAASAKASRTKAPVTKTSAAKLPAAASPVKEPPRYVSMETLKKWHQQNDPRKMPVALQPLYDGKSLKGQDRRDLISDPPIIVMKANAQMREGQAQAGAQADVAVGQGAVTGAAGGAEKAAVVETTEQAVKAGADRTLIAQAFPPAGAVRPATVARTPVTPRWVRYPLEFQLCGIGLGMKAVDKDRFNRIDRYGLFAIHGNPTAVVVPSATGNITVTQQPPEVAALFRDDDPDFLPNWASAVTVQLDNNHVQWLYRRDTYSMGFVVDRLGYVDAIVVAGVYSPIAKTQLEDPVHTVVLGDDMRKVLFRYGYPDDIATYTINYAAGTGVVTAAAPAEGAGAEGGAAAAPGAEGAAAGAGAAAGGEGAGGVANANAALRTFELRYEQSYNVVFTIRNNRVVRIYIFGDPDFFNEQRRNALRREY